MGCCVAETIFLLFGALALCVLAIYAQSNDLLDFSAMLCYSNGHGERKKKTRKAKKARRRKAFLLVC
jgi:hypothetical protein